MSKFRVCRRVVETGPVSYAWIALHRCVEANARLTGEPFTAIFDRLEHRHNFKRTDLKRWPNLQQIQAAAATLQAERDNWLAEWNRLVVARKIEKRAGKRHRRNGRLEELVRRQREHKVPSVGAWGWRYINKLSTY